MYCWWKANSPEAIITTLGDMANMSENDFKEMPNFMDLSDQEKMMHTRKINLFTYKYL